MQDCCPLCDEPMVCDGICIRCVSLTSLFYVRAASNREERGPMMVPYLVQLARDGRLCPNDELRQAGTVSWIRARSFPGLFSGEARKRARKDRGSPAI